MLKKDNINEIGEEALHQLDLLIDDRLIAFFCCTLTARYLGDDYMDLLPTFILLPSQMTKEERLRLAHAIVTLGQNIRKSALNDEYEKDFGGEK